MILMACIAMQVHATALAQDVGFSQFYDQPLLRNPALAGIFTGDIRFTASYRNQWQTVTVPYRTFGLSSEIKFPVQIMGRDLTLTTGLQLLRDIAGTSEFSTTQAMPALNLSIPVSQNSFLSVAFMGGLMQQRFDPSKLVLNDQFVANSDGSFSILPYSGQVFNNTSVNYFDLSTGISYSTSFNENTDFYIGAGLFHITDPEVGFFEDKKIMLNKKLAFNVGLSSRISDRDEIILYGDYFGQHEKDFNYAGVSSFQAGFMLDHDLSVFDDDNKGITAGLLYRLDDAIIPVIQLQLGKFTIGTSYDINISKLTVASQSRGGFEVTLSFKSLFQYRQGDLKGVVCPQFGGHKR
jgi:type IX secretion system PorP/SprF family membrane protein